MELFPDISQMNTSDRASGAGLIAQQGLFGKGLAGNAIDLQIAGLLQVAAGQGLEIIEHSHVHRSSQIMVFFHHVGGGQLVINFFKQLLIFLAAGQVKHLIAFNDNAFEIFDTHDGAAAEAPKVTIGVDIDTGHG